MRDQIQHFEDRQEMRGSTFELFRYRDAYMKEVALHHHDFYEVYFFTTGKLQYIVEGRTYDLKPGDILLIRPMELHQPMFFDRQYPYERAVLWIHRRYMERLCAQCGNLDACFQTSGHTNLLRPERAEREMLQYQLEMIGYEQGSDAPFKDLSAQTYLIQLLIQLSRVTLRTARDPEPGAVSESTVYSVLVYINGHYAEDLPLDELAKRFFVSKYHLSREFKRLFGTSVHRYQIQKRLAVARQMMLEGTSISETYQRCGFGDYSSFYRAFKAEYQISPKEFCQQGQ